MPSWSAEGEWIYFIRTVDEGARWRVSRSARWYR